MRKRKETLQAQETVNSVFSLFVPSCSKDKMQGVMQGLCS